MSTMPALQSSRAAHAAKRQPYSAAYTETHNALTSAQLHAARTAEEARNLKEAYEAAAKRADRAQRWLEVCRAAFQAVR